MQKAIRIRLLVVLLFVIAVAGISGCQADSGKEASAGKERDSVSGQGSTEDAGEASCDVFAMDTYMTVTAYGNGAKKAVDLAEQEIKRLDALLSTGNTDSEVYRINQNGGGSLSEDTAYLVSRSLDLYRQTDGAFDIAIYPVMREWGFADRNFKVPDPDTLKDLLSRADASMITYDKERQEVSFEKEGMQIDLGGIAKGYTSGRIMDIFRSCGLKSGLVNLGGNVQAYGTKTDGSRWRVAIEDPQDTDSYFGILSVQDKAVITSGGYERYFEEDGKTYHHIIDPKTGYPADSGLLSVTIVSEDGTLADGLSTSFFIMGKDRAEKFWQEQPDTFDMILMTDDRSVYITEGIRDDFSSDLNVNVIERGADSEGADKSSS